MYMQCALIKPYSFQIIILRKNESSLFKTNVYFFKKSYLKLKTLASGLWNNHWNTPSRTSVTKSLFGKSRALRKNNNMTWVINNLDYSTHLLFFSSSWKQVLLRQHLHFQVYIMIITTKIQLSRVLSKIIIKNNYYLSHWKSYMIFCKQAKGPFLLERPKPAVPLTISYDQFRLLIGSYSVVEIWCFGHGSTGIFSSWIPVSPAPKSLTIFAKNLHWCSIFCCENLILYQKKKWKW